MNDVFEPSALRYITTPEGVRIYRREHAAQPGEGAAT
jgi:hypothetical protein